MDGVLLVSPHQTSAQSWEVVARQCAPMLGLPAASLLQALQESRRAYRRNIENNAAKQRRDRLFPFETRQETVEHALNTLNRADREAAAEIVRAYEALRDAHRQLAPFALELLQELRNSAFPLALLTNGNATYQRRKIAQHGLAPFFDVILIEEEFGVEKPNPRIFLHALERLHLSAHETWMIGDDLARDIAGAQQVGVFAVWCDFAGRGLTGKIRPDWMIHGLSELRDALIP